MLSSFLVGFFVPVNSFFGVSFIKQDFTGDLILKESSSMIREVTTLPEESSYSGFVVYENDGTLIDWSIEVKDPELSLSATSIENSTDSPSLIDSFPPPNIDFDFIADADWKLEIDFGIAFDAPRYTIERDNNSGITILSEVGLAGAYSYQDPDPTVSLFSPNPESDSASTIPEPATILGLLVASGIGLTFLKR